MKQLSKKAQVELLEVLKEHGSNEDDLVNFNPKYDLIFSDEWLDGADSREELIYLKKQLLKAQGKKARILSVHDVEMLTGNRQHRRLFFKRKRNRLNFRLDGGNLWVVKFND